MFLASFVSSQMLAKCLACLLSFGIALISVSRLVMAMATWVANQPLDSVSYRLQAYYSSVGTVPRTNSWENNGLVFGILRVEGRSPLELLSAPPTIR